MMSKYHQYIHPNRHSNHVTQILQWQLQVFDKLQGCISNRKAAMKSPIERCPYQHRRYGATLLACGCSSTHFSNLVYTYVLDLGEHAENGDN